jgi:hypothetical protein
VEVTDNAIDVDFESQYLIDYLGSVTINLCPPLNQNYLPLQSTMVSSFSGLMVLLH